MNLSASAIRGRPDLAPAFIVLTAATALANRTIRDFARLLKNWTLLLKPHYPAGFL